MSYRANKWRSSFDLAPALAFGCPTLTHHVALVSSRSPYELNWLHQFLVHHPYGNDAICVPYKVFREEKEAGSYGLTRSGRGFLPVEPLQVRTQDLRLPYVRAL